MKHDAPEPLDPELKSLLDVEADFPPEDAARADRVWKNVERAIVVGPSGGGDGGNGSPSEDKPTPPPVVSSLPKYVTVAVIAFVAGGFAGAGLLRTLSPRAADSPAVATAPIASAAPEAPVASAEAEPASAKQASLAPAAASASVAPHPSASAKSTLASTTDLARERAIIEVARTAVARGRYSAALEAIDRHAREFPKGQLAEEREGLRVIALARSGQSSEASERAAAFRKRYPQSVLLPATEAATDSKSQQ